MHMVFGWLPPSRCACHLPSKRGGGVKKAALWHAALGWLRVELGLGLGAAGADVVGEVVLGVVLAEELGELGALGVVGVLVGPDVAWVEDLVGDAGDEGWHVEAEDGVLDGVGFLEDAVEDGGDHGSGVGERETLAAFSGGAAGPAGVDEPDVGVVLLYAVCEHLGVFGGSAGHEWAAEAG